MLMGLGGRRLVQLEGRRFMELGDNRSMESNLRVPNSKTLMIKHSPSPNSSL